MSKDLTEDCGYVRATCNYRYTHKGKDVSMAKDEVFLLIKKTTDDWWQVIRSGDHKTFFAPSKYLEVTDVSIDAMKSSLKKKIAHQRHLQNQQRMYEESRKQQKDHDGVTLEYMDRENTSIYSSDICTVPESISLLDAQNNSSEAKDDNYHYSHKEVIEPPKAFLDVNKNRESQRENSYASKNITNESNCRVNAANLSSVSDGSINEDSDSQLNRSNESFQSSSKSMSTYEKISLCSSPERVNVTINECDSISSHTSKSSLNDISRGSIESFSQIKMKSNMVGKSASFDALQSEGDSLSILKVNQQKAASSEELDHRNRRKEFLFQSDRLSHRNRSNSVELKRFDNNLDLSECEKITSLEKNRKCRLTKDPMNRRRSWALNECPSLNNVKKGKVAEQDASLVLDAPPKLPPKLKKQCNSNAENLPKLEEPQLEQHTGAEHIENNVIDFGSKFPSSFKAEKEEHSFQKSSKIEKNKPIALPRKVILTAPEEDVNSEPKCLSSGFHHSSEKVSKWKKVQSAIATEASKERRERTFKEILNEGREGGISPREKRVEELIERIESQSKMVDSSKVKPQIQAPPSPHDPPRRIVFEDWGEYIDPETGRPFYFNSRTCEKRWKPPRKSICSTHASESPPTATKEKRSIKVPSPVLPHTSIPLWPNRERSFTSASAPLPRVSANALGNDSPGISLPEKVVSHTLPFTPSLNSNAVTGSPKGSQTLPPHPVSPKEPSPTTKSSRSFFSTISSSLSFMKHSGSSSSSHTNQASSSSSKDCPSPSTSHTPPQVPPSSAKPQQFAGSSCSTPATPSSMESLNEEPEQVTLQSALERFHIPAGWTRKYDALSHQVYFESLVTGEKWNPAIDKSGTVYVYSASGGESKWTLQEYEDLSPASPHSPTSLHSPSLPPFEKDKEDSLREDILVWRLTMKEGKKVKKSWSTSYARYYPNLKKNIFGKSFGTVTFSKKQNDTKKAEHFDLVPPCYIDFHLKKQNSLCLRNGDQTEVLIQADTPVIATEWTKLLIEYDKVQEKNLTSEKDKKNTKVPDKSQTKKEVPDENDANKGIKDSLMLFFKRRIQQETLAKKGIYKDTVFGSTIGDLCQKEQLNIPVFVLQCIRNIEKNTDNFRVDGLYRISGNASKIQKIRIEIAQNRYGILEEEKDVHNLTGALKLFFRELKEPLIPFANYMSFIQATDHMKSKSRIEALKQAMKKLPVCNRETLKLLLDHLLKVNEYEQENRMSIMNLAIVFGPCLLWPETTSGFDLMMDAMLHNRVVEALLNEFEEIFRKR